MAKLPRRSFYVVATMAPKCAYDMREIKAPRVTGAGLKLLRRLAEGPRTAKLAYHLVAAPQNNFQQVGARSEARAQDPGTNNSRCRVCARVPRRRRPLGPWQALIAPSLPPRPPQFPRLALNEEPK